MTEKSRLSTSGVVGVLLRLAVLLAAFILGGMVLGGRDHEHSQGQEVGEQADVWTCAMHPQIRQPEQAKPISSC